MPKSYTAFTSHVKHINYYKTPRTRTSYTVLLTLYTLKCSTKISLQHLLIPPSQQLLTKKSIKTHLSHTFHSKEVNQTTENQNTTNLRIIRITQHISQPLLLPRPHWIRRIPRTSHSVHSCTYETETIQPTPNQNQNNNQIPPHIHTQLTQKTLIQSNKSPKPSISSQKALNNTKSSLITHNHTQLHKHIQFNRLKSEKTHKKRTVTTRLREMMSEWT